ncbi:MAG: OmpA family protein [Methylococcaceae bacterium]|nr:OmpA family protein [Methylococcaceae bacterium]
MQTNRYFPLTLIAIAMVSGCSSVPNQSLITAHESYNNARSNPEITNLAALELKQADDSLNKADTAFSKDDNDPSVDHFAYLAQQQVGIAEATAKRKAAETAVNNASGKRDQVRLEARTAEADAANQQVAIAHATNDRQATELAVASANTARDQALIAQQEMQLKELNAKKTQRGMVITLGDVLFSTNKAQLKAGGVRNMEKLAAFLTQYPQYKVSVEGHTDSRASNKYNQELSDRRADAVRTVLTNRSVSSDRVSTHGYGEEFPIASNNNAGGRQLNRRVEIILSDENGNIIPR